MRSLATLALTLVLALALGGCTGAKIGVVNPTRLFQDSATGKAGLDHLKQMETVMQEQLVMAQGMIEKAPDDEALRTRFQQEFAGYQQIVTAEQQKVVESINEQIQSTLENYRKQKGFTAILNGEGVLAYSADVDVTDAVIAEMNRDALSFAPVKLEPLKVQPSSAPALPTSPALKTSPATKK